MNSYMKRDTRLSSMLHLLLHMAQAGRPLTSEELARMLRTNPVLVRRTLAGLRERRLVSAEKGHGGGWVLVRPLASVTLCDVYEALGEPELFALGHRADQPNCRVEQAVKASLDQTLSEAEALVLARLREVTLATLLEAGNLHHPDDPHGQPPDPRGVGPGLATHQHAGGSMEHASDAEFWNERYRHHSAEWDSEPNPILAQEVADLAPGTALDVGCGEGSDAVWLANRGWRVTAVDISHVALDRGRAADPDGLVDWLQADVLTWQPPEDAYDLVSTHFLHVLPAQRQALFARLARAVRPNGTLLVVAHHVSDLETTIGRPPNPDLYFTADEVAALLPGRWEIRFGGTRARQTTDREGHAVTIRDMVLKARRVE